MGPQGLSRFNMFNSISVNADPAPGYSSGQAMEAVARVAKQTLPSGYGYEYSGLSREEGNTSNNFVIVAALSLLIIYLVLVALYESLILPFAILLAVPVGIMGSFLFAQLFGLQNNIYLQTGVVLLIGLLSKTAILLTEYAVKRREAGMRITQAAFSCQGPSAPDPHDCPRHDLRSVAVDGCFGSWSQRKPIFGIGCRGWHADRQCGAALPCPRFLRHLPMDAGALDAPTAH